MTADSGAPDTVVTDRIYAGIATVAALLALAESPRTAWAIGCIAVGLLPWGLVAVRREPPLWLFALLAVGAVIPLVITNNAGVVTFMTTSAASRVASRSDDRWFVAGVTAVVLAVPFLPLLFGHPWNYGAGYFAFGNAFGVLVGVLLRRATRLAAELRAADARLAEAAGREERQRIARDVHDLVAHSLTVVVLHIGGARRVLRADPRAAEAALADAERVCRESLDGIRGVVGLLREADDRPGLSLDLEELAETYRSAGRPVALLIDGDPAALPLAVRVALYRVLQESLANAARHTGPEGTVSAAVEVGDAAVDARIENGPPEAFTPASAPGAGGFGLLGLREQVEALGGELHVGPTERGWQVACRLPVRDAALPATRVGGTA